MLKRSWEKRRSEKREEKEKRFIQKRKKRERERERVEREKKSGGWTNLRRFHVHSVKLDHGIEGGEKEIGLEGLVIRFLFSFFFEEREVCVALLFFSFLFFCLWSFLVFCSK